MTSEELNTTLRASVGMSLRFSGVHSMASLSPVREDISSCMKQLKTGNQHRADSLTALC